MGPERSSSIYYYSPPAPLRQREGTKLAYCHVPVVSTELGCVPVVTVAGLSGVNAPFAPMMYARCCYYLYVNDRRYMGLRLQYLQVNAGKAPSFAAVLRTIEG